MAKWSDMTPAERSDEMKRRQATAKRNKKHNKRQANSWVKHYVCKHCGQKFDDKYRLANHIRYDHPKAKKGAKHGSHSAEAQEDHSPHIFYLFGKVETIIEHYASSAGIPWAPVATGVAELIRRKAVR